MSPILAALGSIPGSQLDGVLLRSNSQQVKNEIDRLLQEHSLKALRKISDIVNTLDWYAPALKGLQDVHKYTMDTLETIVFSSGPSRQPAAFLLGHVLAMYPLTADAVTLTIENILLGGESDLAMCAILGVKRASSALFEAHLPTLLRQIQMTPSSIAQDALKEAMKLYSPGESGKSQWIIEATHSVFAASLRNHAEWASFIICHTPMLLRNDLRKRYPETCDASSILGRLLANPGPMLSRSLPILTTWETRRFCADGSVDRIVQFMMTLSPQQAFDGLGQLASVVLEKFASHLPQVAAAALAALSDPDLWAASQLLLRRLLSALGPITLDMMISYLKSPASLLLTDVRLLDLIASLLPNLRNRVILVLVDAIDAKSTAVLAALTVFPLQDPYLAQRAQELVLWSLDESRERTQILLALQLATDARIATPSTMRTLTYKAAQLLLSDDPHVVHTALHALSNPSLAGSLDEQSCQMILLSLHQSLEPSIQIVAAKLLTHLSTGHRAIVQPLAWAHIRQSLSLMDFLQTIDPRRAIVEACITSNLLPALPASVHSKYVGPVKDLILQGLQQTHDSQTLSLIFQGLANLAKFGTWQATQQTQLACDLLDLSPDIPRDAQHSALNAIARLLAAPQDRGDLYDMLILAHTTFKNHTHLDPDSKALVAGIFGVLGTVEKSPIITRDATAAILREHAVYDEKRVRDSQVADARDKSGAARHVNWLVSKALLGGKKSEDILEAMAALGILQPGAVPAIMPDLPATIMKEVQRSLDRKTKPLPNMIPFLSSSLHASPVWLNQHWAETADLMGRCITEGEILSVLKGMTVVLQAC